MTNAASVPASHPPAAWVTQSSAWLRWYGDGMRVKRGMSGS